MKKGELALASIYKHPDPLPEMQESFIQEDQATGTTEEEVTGQPNNHQIIECVKQPEESQPLTSQSGASAMMKPKELESMVITIGKLRHHHQKIQM